MYEWFKAINDRNLNVRVIFGRDKFITDYDEMCLKKQAGCGVKEQYVSDFDVALQSDKEELPQLPKPRKWNFNINYSNSGKYCENGFP